MKTETLTRIPTGNFEKVLRELTFHSVRVNRSEKHLRIAFRSDVSNNGDGNRLRKSVAAFRRAVNTRPLVDRMQAFNANMIGDKNRRIRWLSWCISRR